MSARACVHVSKYADADGGQPPNAFIPSITVEVRVHYPPVHGNLQLAKLKLADAYLAASDELDRRYLEGLE